MRLAAEWVSPQHLAWDALERAHAAFAASPARALVLADFLHAPVAERLARFLADDAEFATTVGLVDRYGPCTEEEFAAAPVERRFFRYGRLAGARPGDGLAAFRAFERGFAEPSLRALFQAVSHLPLAGFAGSVRRMGPGDFLVAHEDDVDGRVLSFVLYLTPGWRREHGGLLVFADGTEVPPAYNSIVIFDARTRHHVTPISDGAPPRYTIGGWYKSS